MREHGRSALGIAKVPDMHGHAAVARGQPRGVRRKRHGMDGAAGMAEPQGLGLGISQVPHKDNPIPVAGRDATAILAEGDRLHAVLVTGELQGSRRSHTRTIGSPQAHAR